ncbi:MULTISPECIES: hypothetical protein [Streptacidiphilus]|uniref:DUF317 domain-containing protein n=1 Tax=Streptacidiphilus cavernicola TaxID=3342716 RepID=A0ABV6UP75_9ACTN|nr:hypothetical protein [Streptacidiphilus jeojiense]
MTGPEPPLSNDAHYLSATARFHGWAVDVESGGDMQFTLLDRVLAVRFWHDGGFRFATAHGPDSARAELDLPQVLEALEQQGKTPPSPV